MSKHPRIPGTRAGRALFVMASIPDELPSETKNALALRNTASVAGRCPSCGAEFGQPRRDEHGVYHITMLHEADCQALTDGQA